MTSTNPLENSQPRAKAIDTAEKAPEKTLSQVYSDPQQFLAILQKDYTGIASDPKQGITLPDLELYAKQGSDAAGRQVAKELATNFPAAVNMFQTSEQLNVPDSFYLTKDRITSSELDNEQKIISGNYKSQQEGTQLSLARQALVMGAESAAFAAITPGAFIIPPLGVTSAAMSAGIGAFAVWAGKTALELPTEYKAAESSGNNLIRSWKNS